MNSGSKKFFLKTALPNEDVRSKAQWIAERLVGAGLEESKATRIAVATAMHWHSDISTSDSPTTSTEKSLKHRQAKRLDESA